MTRAIPTLRVLLRLLIAALVLAGGSGCDGLSALTGLGSGAGVAVIDLTAVAKALGRDEAFREQLDTANRQLTQQLSDYSNSLRNQLQDERSKLGETPSEQQRQQLAQLATQAQRQVQQTQARAQQQARALQLKLAEDFRGEVRPVAMSVAKGRGLSGVVLAPGMLWFEPDMDITDEVIAQMRATDGGASPQAETEPATSSQ